MLAISFYLLCLVFYPKYILDKAGIILIVDDLKGGYEKDEAT